MPAFTCKHLMTLMLAATCSAGTPSWAAPPAPQDLGANTAADLQYRYDNQAQNCSPTTPAFLCSGVLLRVTTALTQQAPWDPVLPNNYGLSFSYLRQDANFSALTGAGVNGFIVYPVMQQPANKLEIEVLCAFPVAAGTERRSDAGCGANSDYPTDSGRCDQQHITDASAWLAHYMEVAEQQRGYHQCGFSVSAADRPQSVAYFNAFLLAHRFLQTAAFNEVRLDTWPTHSAGTLPLQAFFYLAGSSSGRSQAMRDQEAFKLASGGMVKPVIRLTLPSNINGRALFEYSTADQHATPIPDPSPAPYPRQITQRCAKYISRASWYTQAGGDALAVTPTDCARNNLPATDHAFAADELLRDWGNDRRYINASGMRNQYLCHLKNAPTQATWDLEPWRPDVGLARTEAAFCNPNPSGTSDQ